MAHNNNIGKISNNNVSIKGSGNIDTTSDQGSLLGLRYIKDDELGTGSPTTTPVNVDSVSLKNWFAQFVTTLGNFSKSEDDNENIKFGDYRGASILGFKAQAINETSSQYQNNNNAGIKISPLNGSLGSYTVTAGDQSTTVSAGLSATLGRGGGRFNSGQSVNIAVKDNTTNVTASLTWFTAYVNGDSFVTGTTSVSQLGRRFNFNWADNNARSTTYSNELFFFLGRENTRAYGESY